MTPAPSIRPELGRPKYPSAGGRSQGSRLDQPVPTVPLPGALLRTYPSPEGQ